MAAKGLVRNGPQAWKERCMRKVGWMGPKSQARPQALSAALFDQVTHMFHSVAEDNPVVMGSTCLMSHASISM